MIKKLSIYIQRYEKYAIVVPIFVFCESLCELYMPLLMAKIVDIGIPNGDIPYIFQIGLYMALLACIAMVCGFFIMKFSSLSSQGFGANLRDAMFKKVQSFSFKNIDYFSTASLVTRLTNDVNNMQLTVMMMLRIMLRAPMMLIISFFLAYSINARLSIILAVAIVVLASSIWLIVNTAVKLYTLVQQKIDAINSAIQENLIGIRIVKSFVRSDFEKAKFGKANDALTEAAIKAANIGILVMPIMILVMNVATLAIIWNGGLMVYTNELGAGELISFLSYVFQILLSVMMISMIILMSARAQASGERVVEVLDARVDIVNKIEAQQEMLIEKERLQLPAQSMGKMTFPNVQKGKVEFRNVYFKYNLAGSGEDVISNINFVAQPGEVIAIVGGTGTGKSTMVNLIPRLYDVTDGMVLIDDIDVRDYELETLRQDIGVVLQKNTLFSGTIYENLLWGNEHATREEVETAAKDAQAHEFVMSFPDGYDTQLGQGGVNVSGGQKQRLCIARAMLKKPKILILDDSTSAVDSTTEAKIRESFYHRLADATVFIIAQRISSVRDADKILVLDDGKIVGFGTHKELMKTNAVYQEINSSQQEGVAVNE
ncbi:MAG: ABC transporter ATP-binding protein [Anaerolineales bacterium]|nr:ABC transporter ATP-binding protein [Anaerolineales bacterium]